MLYSLSVRLCGFLSLFVTAGLLQVLHQAQWIRQLRPLCMDDIDDEYVKRWTMFTDFEVFRTFFEVFILPNVNDFQRYRNYANHYVKRGENKVTEAAAAAAVAAATTAPPASPTSSSSTTPRRRSPRLIKTDLPEGD